MTLVMPFSKPDWMSGSFDSAMPAAEPPGRS